MYGPRLPRKTAPAAVAGRVPLTLADDVDPSGPRLDGQALPRQRRQLLDAQAGVEQRRDDRVSHRAGSLGIAAQPAALNVGEPFGRELLRLDVDQVLRRVLRQQIDVGRPAIEAAQRSQGGVHRCGLLALGELGPILAQIARGDAQEVRLVALLEPRSEALHVGDVQPRRALADPGVLGQEHHERPQWVIGRNSRALANVDRLL